MQYLVSVDPPESEGINGTKANMRERTEKNKLEIPVLDAERIMEQSSSAGGH